MICKIGDRQLYWVIMVTDEQIAQNYHKYRRFKTFWLIIGGLAGSALATLIIIVMTLLLLMWASGRRRYGGSWLYELSAAQFWMIFVIAFVVVILLGLASNRQQSSDITGGGDESDPTVFGAYAIYIFAFAQGAFWRGVMLILQNRSRDEATVAVWLCRRDWGCDCAAVEKSTGVPPEVFLPGFRRLNVLVPLADRRKIALASKVRERLMSKSGASFWEI